MAAGKKSVKEYLAELQKGSPERPDQVKDAIEIYVDLWKSAVKKRIIEEGDEVSDALRKIDAAGGLYAVAHEVP
jgi:hypothetical protein